MTATFKPLSLALHGQQCIAAGGKLGDRRSQCSCGSQLMHLFDFFQVILWDLLRPARCLAGHSRHLASIEHTGRKAIQWNKHTENLISTIYFWMFSDVSSDPIPSAGLMLLVCRPATCPNTNELLIFEWLCFKEATSVFAYLLKIGWVTHEKIFWKVPQLLLVR